MAEELRILQLHNHHASLGGAMEVLSHEAVILEQAGHCVQQYTLPPTEQLQLSGVEAGLKAVWNADAYRAVTQRIRLFRPDVVHVHTPFPLMSPSVFRAAATARVPAVTTLHSYRYSCIAGTCVRNDEICEDCVGSRSKWPGAWHRCYHDSFGASAALTLSLGVHRALGTFHRHVSRYLALTEFSRRLLIRDGIPAGRVVVKPNSVPDPGKQSQPDDTRPFVVFAGRLIDVKGVRTLLNAWTQVTPGVTLKIAGDGVLRPLVEERARSDASIDYLGWVSEEQLTDLYGRAQCVLMPSEWYEGGLPLVVLRSLSVGTPVVVSDVENFAHDVLKDRTGWTFRVGDAADLGRTLNIVLSDAERLRAARPRARASYLRRYSPQVDVQRLEAVYQDVIRVQHTPLV